MKKEKVQSEGHKHGELIPSTASENGRARRQKNSVPALCMNFEMVGEALSRVSLIRHM